MCALLPLAQEIDVLKMLKVIAGGTPRISLLRVAKEAILLLLVKECWKRAES